LVVEPKVVLEEKFNSGAEACCFENVAAVAEIGTECLSYLDGAGNVMGVTNHNITQQQTSEVNLRKHTRK